MRRSYRDIDIVMCELSGCCLQHAKEHHICADCHEGDVQVRGINILSWRLVSMAPTNLQLQITIDRCTSSPFG